MIALRVILWIATGLLLYTYAGYPLLVKVLGRSARPKAGGRRALPSVAIIVAARNEEDCIASRIENALALDYPAELLEVVVVSDGSTDKTDEIVGELASRRVRLVRSGGRVGQGRCQALGVADTDAELILFSDANTSFDTDALAHLVLGFEEMSIGCVVGSLCYADTVGMHATGEGAYWRYEEALKEAESRLGACVSGTGAIYAIRREDYRFVDDRAPADFCLPLLIAGRGLRVHYERRAVARERAAADVWAELRRHVRTAQRGAFCLFRVPEVRALLHPFRFPRLAWQLWSHKAIRWLTGIWLALAVSASIGAYRSGPIYAAVLCALAFLVCLAAWGALQALFRTSKTGWPTRMAFFLVATSVAMLLGFFFGALLGRSRTTWESQR